MIIRLPNGALRHESGKMWITLIFSHILAIFMAASGFFVAEKRLYVSASLLRGARPFLL
jgi:hypothetical protein